MSVYVYSTTKSSERVYINKLYTNASGIFRSGIAVWVPLRKAGKRLRVLLPLCDRVFWEFLSVKQFGSGSKVHRKT